ncbi:MAG TPA: acyl-CoA dehydrogenase C-terminal domain-containing protein [Alphaproteobacteria bacterium]|nr:acyl-CoA dehydrogenase C-terminal domain-containing protein [Alphaproteobacteria bacterium]
MATYTAPLDNIRFVMNEVLGVGDTLAALGLTDATADVIDAVLEEAAKLCENELQPLNLSGDTEGCSFENGVVRTPKGFIEAYKTFCEGGWVGLTADPQYGGQGMPHFLGSILDEMVSSANTAFGMYPGLSSGAYRAIEMHGNDEQKQLYLPKLTEGIWSGTMCLTEPQCGTDLGLIRTKAVPEEDGSYKITGTKIFISAGEHDLTENIIHLVLAKLPDAPPGTRGISLFIVPKFLPKEEGGKVVAGARNGIFCGSIEHKMGIKASATCVMNLEDAKGWLVGEPHKGMRAMFTMMNAARLGVAIQGLGLAEVAYQNALGYAKDRLQGRSLTGDKAKDKPADPIIVHPDVRKNLLTVKAFVEGARALGLWVSLQLDIEAHDSDPKKREAAADLLALMTPIVKAYFTDAGFESAVTSMQVWGGHGYIHENGVEQFVRDARITQIYEGANGIQALDLVGRKLPANMGRSLRRFFHPVLAFIEENKADAELAELLVPFGKAVGKLQQATGFIAQKGLANPDEAGAASTSYLRMFALVALGYMWLRMAKVAKAKLGEANGKAAFYGSKIKTARFFVTKILPETEQHFRAIMAGSKPLMDVAVEEF